MTFSQGHALIIGVGNYSYAPQMNVPITVTDAQEIAAVIGDTQLCGYPKEQVTLLTNATATRDDMFEALERLAQRTGDEDIVFIFYCGHGHYGDDGAYYLTTHDTQLQKGKVVSNTGVREAEFIDRLRAIKAKRLLFICNACHSGELSPTLANDATSVGEPFPPQAAAALLATGTGRAIITACREKQKSYIGTGQLTLFTQALVDGLRGQGVSSQRGYISVFDLYTHIFFTVAETVQQRYRAVQEPELTVLKNAGAFPVALYRGASLRGEFEPQARPADGTAVRDVGQEYSVAMLEQILRILPATQPTQGVNFGSGNTFGDITLGDIAGRDIVKHIHDAPPMHLGISEGEQLRRLIVQLNSLVDGTPHRQAEEVAAVTMFAHQLGELATQAVPNRVVVRVVAENLEKAGQSLTANDPDLLQVVMQIVNLAQRLTR